MSDLISREKAIDALMALREAHKADRYTGDLLHWTIIKAMLGSLPPEKSERTAKVERCYFGETLTYDFDGQCECGKWVDALWDYCPSCGARLEWK